MRKLLLQRKYNSKGTTIVELLVYMGILSILLTILMSLFSTVVDTQLDAESNSDVQMDGRYLISRLSYDIHRADAIASPALGDSSDVLQLTINGSTNSYTVDANGNLTLTDASDVNTVNGYGTTIKDVTFRHVGNVGGSNNTVQITFTVQSRIEHPTGEESKTYTTTIGLR